MPTLNKKLVPVLGVILIILVGASVFAINKISHKNTEPATEQTQKKRSRAEANIIEVAERPYVKIMPQASGRNLIIEIDDVKKGASSVEYELEYQAGTLLQGAFGSIELASLPTSEDILLGSCSAGGACTYHEDVKGGTLLLDFQGSTNYVLKQDWKYIINSDRETAHSSRDAKFQIEADVLGKQSYLVIYNTPGYPKGLEGTLVSDIYSLQTSSALSGSADLSIRATEEGDLTIIGYDGQTWHQFDTTTDGKTATAEVKLMELYAVVK